MEDNGMVPQGARAQRRASAATQTHLRIATWLELDALE